jgi:hypothetical protein
MSGFDFDNPVTFEYEVVLRIKHTEPSNPDMPSLNVNTLAEGVAVRAKGLMSDIEVAVESARLLGEVN